MGPQALEGMYALITELGRAPLGEVLSSWLGVNEGDLYDALLEVHNFQSDLVPGFQSLDLTSPITYMGKPHDCTPQNSLDQNIQEV